MGLTLNADEVRINWWKVASIVLIIFALVLVAWNISNYEKEKRSVNLGEINISEKTLEDFMEIAKDEGWTGFYLVDTETGKFVRFTKS